MISLPIRLSLVILLGEVLFRECDAAVLWDTTTEDPDPLVPLDAATIVKTLLDSGAVRITELHQVEPDVSFTSFDPSQLRFQNGEVFVNTPVASFTIDLEKFYSLMEGRPDFAKALMATVGAGENQLPEICEEPVVAVVDRIKRNINLSLNIVNAGHRRPEEWSHQQQSETIEEQNEQQKQDEVEEFGQTQSANLKEITERKVSPDQVFRANFGMVANRLNELRDVCIDFLERTSSDVFPYDILDGVRDSCFSILEEIRSWKMDE